MSRCRAPVLAKRNAMLLKLPVEASPPVFARERALWADAVSMTGATAD